MDPLTLADVIWILCETQASESNVSAEEFYTRLAPHIDDAVTALEAAVTNFFPASKRSLILSIRSQNETLTKNATTKAMETLATNQEAIETAMEKRMQRELTKLLASFDSVDSAASTSAT